MTQLTEDVRSISRLFGDALDNFSKLLQTEIRLARAELTQKASQAAVAIALLAGAMLLVIPALVLFLIALAVGMVGLGLPAPAAYALSGLLALVVAAGLALVGMARLKPEVLAPRVTMDEVRQDISAAKEMAS
ncbi:MAG: phage holin family protein [Alphaproteobacteria bacterium]|nr:phage holin family protein [Alphaproteobacteria bacterium]